jgi:predicted Zn-dependent protease
MIWIMPRSRAGVDRSLALVSVLVGALVALMSAVAGVAAPASEGAAPPSSSSSSSSVDAKGAETRALSPEDEQQLKEYEAELDLGRGMAGRLLQQFKPIEDKELTAYVTKVGLLVAASSPHASRQFVFGVLDTDTINAFAMPGGYIFVTRGTLENARSEAEIAAILGHEIAHVGNRHIYNAMLNRSRKSKAKDAWADDPETITARKRPESSSSDTAQTLARLVGGQMNVLAAVQTGFGVLFEEGLDPKLETEADTEAVNFSLSSGYEPGALVSYFERIIAKRDAAQTKILNKTHPPIAGRIKSLNAAVAKTVPNNYRGALGEERFQAVMAKFKNPK